MLLEYMDLGDLRRYLQSNGPNIDTEQRLWYCSEVAAGMAYLASIPVIHRDVAARNVLLKTNPNPNGVPRAVCLVMM
jgi:serine/threonine protein kinase